MRSSLMEYIRRRWVTIAIACAVALGIALTSSLTLPKRYTATASLIVQAPGENDPRASTAVSPIYLESLKAYESMASSDTLFAPSPHRTPGAGRQRKRFVLVAEETGSESHEAGQYRDHRDFR